MSSSKTTFLSFLIFTILIGSTTAFEPLFHFCSNPKNYTAGSAFAADLNSVVDKVTAKIPTGFSSATVGHATGLALCRGDIKPAVCKSCAAAAWEELKARCPYNKAAVIWYDECLVKYSDQNFLGVVDMANRFYMWNVNDVSKDPKGFDGHVAELLGGLGSKAADAVVVPMYAVGNAGIGAGPDGTLYGLAQCTRDLSGPNCKKCLDDAVAELPKCCTGKRGGRVVGGSCYVRYELYPIVNSN